MVSEATSATLTTKRDTIVERVAIALVTELERLASIFVENFF